MNDLTTELRRMADEAEQVSPPVVAGIFDNGDRVRRRTLAKRSAAGLTAAAALAAVAVSVSAGQPGAHRAAPSVALGVRKGTPQRVQLTAWTVSKQADGDVSLTVRQFADTARLQQTLRADGVPASVLAQGQANPCRIYGTADIGNVVTGHTSAAPEGAATATAILTIHPSALPSGDGLQFVPSSDFAHPGTTGSLGFRLVQASPACTGG